MNGVSRAYRGEAPRFDQPPKHSRLSARTGPHAGIGESRFIAAAESALPLCSMKTYCGALATVSRRRAHGFCVFLRADRTKQVSPQPGACGYGAATWVRAPQVMAWRISYRERPALRSRLRQASSGRRRSAMIQFQACEQEKQRRSRRRPRRT